MYMTIKTREWTLDPVAMINLPDPYEVREQVAFVTRGGVGGAAISLMELDARHSYDDGVIDIHTPWSEALADRPDAVVSNGTLIRAFGQLGYAMDVPGVGVGAQELTPKQVSSIADGNLEDVVDAQWQARNGVSSQAPGPRRAFSSSQGGTTLAAFMARAPRDVRYDQAIFYEPAGVYRQAAGSLAVRFALDTVFQQRRVRRYRQESPGEGDLLPGSALHNRTMAKAMMNQPQSYLAYLRAMSQGTILENLRSAYDNGVIGSQSSLVFVTGADSHVSPPEANERLVYELSQSIGVGAIDLVVLLGENHSMYDSLRRKYALATRLRDEIPCLG